MLVTECSWIWSWTQVIEVGIAVVSVSRNSTLWSSAAHRSNETIPTGNRIEHILTKVKGRSGLWRLSHQIGPE